MNKSNPPTIAEALAPLLPDGADAQSLLSTATADRLANDWQELTQLGFAIEVGADQLKVRHSQRGFALTIQLSRPDDIGELRKLFLTLRSHFGNFRERLLPWLFLPGTGVTVPYAHLRTIIAACQHLRQGHAT